MKLTWTEYAVFGLAVVLLVMGIYLYPRLPAQMASHWNAQGEVDGYIPRLWGVLIGPSVIALVGLVFVIFPRIDPLRANIKEFRAELNVAVMLISLVLAIIFLQSLLWNVGIKISFNRTVPSALGVLFYYLGVVMGKAKRNWFIGLRTPWTLSDDLVWDKTHQLAAVLFRIAGVLAMLGTLFPSMAMWFVLLPIMTAALIPAVYSYLFYSRKHG